MKSVFIILALSISIAASAQTNVTNELVKATQASVIVPTEHGKPVDPNQPLVKNKVHKPGELPVVVKSSTNATEPTIRNTEIKATESSSPK